MCIKRPANLLDRDARRLCVFDRGQIRFFNLDSKTVFQYTQPGTIMTAHMGCKPANTIEIELMLCVTRG